MLHTCLYALVGKLVMNKVEFREGDFETYAECEFKLDAETGVLVNGDAARENDHAQNISTTNTIMTVLVILLLVAMGMIMVLGSFQPISAK